MEIYEKFKDEHLEEAKFRWSKQQPPADNIFVEFKCPPNIFDRSPTWKLFWDPSLESNENGWIPLAIGIHCKMSSYLFRKKSQAIQKKLVKVFPQHFQLSFENYEEHDFDYEDDEMEYHPACGIDCANCGFCW